MADLTHLSLFSGIGGLDLAAEWAGFRTVGQCEWADYPTKVLEKHWPGVPRWRDIRTLTGESFYERTGLHTVDVISGGFPCQPFSVAGKRRGAEDDRYLWPEMLRVIQEIRPAWVIGENVAGIVNMALDTVLSDLGTLGYTCQAFIIPTCAVDAPHRRDRCAIVAYSERSGCGGQRDVCNLRSIPETNCKRPSDQPCKPSEISGNVADADNGSRDVRRKRELSAAESTGTSWADHGGRAPEHGGGEWWPAEPNVGRVADGVPFRVDRLKGLGNAVALPQFYPIFQAIADIERGGESEQ